MISFNFAAPEAVLKKLHSIHTVEECDATKVEQHYYSRAHKNKGLLC